MRTILPYLNLFSIHLLHGALQKGRGTVISEVSTFCRRLESSMDLSVMKISLNQHAMCRHYGLDFNTATDRRAHICEQQLSMTPSTITFTREQLISLRRSGYACDLANLVIIRQLVFRDGCQTGGEVIDGVAERDAKFNV